MESQSTIGKARFSITGALQDFRRPPCDQAFASAHKEGLIRKISKIRTAVERVVILEKVFYVVLSGANLERIFIQIHNRERFAKDGQVMLIIKANLLYSFVPREKVRSENDWLCQ